MKPLRTITQMTAISGLALTGYAFITDEFGILNTFALIVFFFWAHIHATTEINM